MVGAMSEDPHARRDAPGDFTSAASPLASVIEETGGPTDSLPVVDAHPSAGRGVPAHRDLTTGSVPRKLFHQSWPQVVEGLVNIAYQVVDLIYAGLLPDGTRAIAGLGVAQSFAQFGMMSRQGLDQSL